MDKSQVLKYLQEISEDLDTVDTDFHRALIAIDGNAFAASFDIKRSDLVLDARQIRNDLSVVIENLSLLIVAHDTEEE
tara:strand:+ start:746 stop:979 length:234 start_codon:yes stop_codon:yes gene_type:complete